jgi:peptidylprolyl isomerase
MTKKVCTSLISAMLLLILFMTGCRDTTPMPTNIVQQVKTGDTVKVHYTGKLQDGTVFDTSSDGEPLEFTVGDGQVISGFEQAVIGMQVGESKTRTIPVDQAYGPRSDDMIMEVSRDKLPEDLEPEVGMQLQMNDGNGGIVTVTITDISETAVKLDANHPLAGQDLTFDIELVGIGASSSQGAGLTSTSLGQALANGKPTIAEFGSSSCIPCKQMKPILEKLAVDYKGKLNVVIVEVYEQKELTQKYGIMGIPTQIVFDSSGNEVTRHIGYWSMEEIIAQLGGMGVR